MERTRRFGSVGAGRQKRQRSLFIEASLAFVAVLALGYVALERDIVGVPGFGNTPTAQPDMIARNFTLCSGGGGGTCVIDGDTIRIDGQSIRIADIDTPEVRGYRCQQELALGEAATQRLVELVNSGPFELGNYERDEDFYGRKLRILRRDGQSLGMILVAEGLARPWGGARQSWCG